ncbi:ABC transporter substrate-binding protein [Glaciibacter superstes]|uniref:ABC transporter substrate-binding protein n=1 Tax=Glaciibacter superstes TaxID=501023 RepID=UPI0012F8C359|nr:sugar ABC transporter substrate-binding protein [Glaciibacter superstes]
MKKTTRKSLAILTGLGMVLSIAACGSPSDNAGGGDAEGGGTITVVLSNHPWQRALEPLIPEFEKESGIEVKVQTFAEQQARDKILLNLQSKSNAMDVYMTLPSREGPQFSSSGYYEELDDYLESAPEDYKATDFSPGAMDGMQADGATIALPINVEGPVLYYRKDVFDELGLKVPGTMEELIEVSKTIKEQGDGMIPITLRGASAAIPFTFGPFFHGEGLSWTTDGKANFDDPAAATAIDEYATLARDCGPPGVINYSFTESSNLFAQGKVAMELESSNELNSVIGESSTVVDQVGVAPIPAGSVEAAPTALSWGIGMSPFSESKDAAWEFMQWATSPEIQLALTEGEIAPPRDSVAADPEYTDTFDTDAKKEWGEAVADIQANGFVEVGPVGAEAPAMRKVIGDAIGKAILGEITAEQAAAEIQEGLTPLLDTK